MIIGSTEVVHKLANMVNWFKEQYGFEINGLDFHPRTIANQKEIYSFAYSTLCSLAIIKSFNPSAVYSTRFAPLKEETRFIDHLYRKEFYNEEKSVETSVYNDMLFKYDRKRITSRPNFFSTPLLIDELLPVVTAKTDLHLISLWFSQQLLVGNNFSDPEQKSVYPEIQIRPINASSTCKVLPGEWDQSEIILGQETVQTKGKGNQFPSSPIFIGGFLENKPLVILCKPKVEKIKLSIREELKEIIELVGLDRVLLITEHQIWKKYFTFNLGVSEENVCIDNKWNDATIKEFIENHKNKLEF